MDNNIPSNELMHKVELAAAAPEPSEKFFNDLRLRLENRAETRRMAGRKTRRIALSLSLAAFLILGACILIAGPANVATAIRDALGYIPGVGIVHTTGLRMLAEPVVVTRDGITVTLKSVVADSTHTLVMYEVAGLNLSNVDPLASPDPNACSSPPFLRLPDGQELQSIGGGGGGGDANYMESSEQFPPIPESVEDASLVLPCLLVALPGTAPGILTLSFHLVRNPTLPTVFPVQQIDTPASESTGTPTVGSETNPFLNQISLKIDSIFEAEDGFIIMGSIQTSSDQYMIASHFPQIVIRDSTGAKIEVETASLGNVNPTVPVDPNTLPQWAYKVKGKHFHGPLTLSVDWLTIIPNDPILFTVDVGPHPQDGQTWTLEKQLNLFGLLAEVQSAKYVVGQDLDQGMQGLEFSIRLPEGIEGLQLNYWDPNPQPGPDVWSSELGDGFTHGQDIIQEGFLTTLPLSGTVGVTAGVLYINGPWTVTWNPPTVEGAPSPTPIP
jgi:hypothetical protein